MRATARLELWLVFDRNVRGMEWRWQELCALRG